MTHAWMPVAQKPMDDQWILMPTTDGLYVHGRYRVGGGIVDVQGNEHSLKKCWLPAPPPLIDCGGGGLATDDTDDDADDADDDTNSLFGGQINALKEATDQLLVNTSDALELTAAPLHSTLLGELRGHGIESFYDWPADSDLLFHDHIQGMLQKDFVIPLMRSASWRLVAGEDELSLATFERTKGKVIFRLVVFRNGTSLSIVEPSLIEFSKMSTLMDMERFILKF